MTTVGYIRFNLPIVLDYQHASVKTKGTDRRLGILEAIVKKGYDVHVYTPVESKPNGVGLDQFFGGDESSLSATIDYNFLDHLDYQSSVAKPDCDVLWIECSTDNSMFSFKDRASLYPEFMDHTVPYIYRTYALLNEYEGPVVLFQHDTSLMFSLETQHIGKDLSALNSKGVLLSQLSQNNLGMMARKFTNIFKNKEYKLVTTANPDMLQKFHSSNASRGSFYRNLKSKCHIPLCYSENIDIEHEPKEKPEFDFTYVGSEDKFRYKQLSALLRNINGRIIGNWESKVAKMQMAGIKGNHADVYRFYNESYCGMQLPNVDDIETSNMTSRFVQIIRGGAIALISSLYPQEVLAEYGEIGKVSTASDVEEQIAFVKNLSYSQRVELNKMQRNALHRWVDLSWNEILRV